MSNVEESAPQRQLTLIDCLGIGINGIVGSGIFLLPAALWRRAGGQAPLAWLIVGGVCALVALCFAEVAARTEKSGGPYRYACDAFGPYVGFGVGWVTLVSTILAYAAVARAFGDAGAKLLGHPDHATLGMGLACGMVVFLCAVNVLGVRGSARTSDVISGVKLASLLLFVGIGLFFVKFANLHAAPQPRPDEQSGLIAAAFAGLFATTGFEYIPVPAGEAKNPRRTIPLAMIISVLATTVLYALVQIVASGVHPQLGRSESSLVDAAGQFLPYGALLMNLAFLLSAFGFCASSALVGPRYLEVFAEDRFFPATFFGHRSERFGTPVAAVVVLSALVFVLLISGLKFDGLADASNMAVIIQYMATCIAVLVLRRKSPAPAGAFVIPLGPLVPLMALLCCCLFLRPYLASVKPGELKLVAAMIGTGLAVGWLSRHLSISRGA